MRAQEALYRNILQKKHLQKRNMEFCRQAGIHKRNILGKSLLLIIMTCLIIVCGISYHAVNISADTGEKTILFKYYTSVPVRYGETLWEIADEYIDYSQYQDKNDYVNEVMSINQLNEDGTVKAGQHLILPYYSAEYK